MNRWNPHTISGRERVNAHKREYRKRPEVQERLKEQRARYRKNNLEKLREQNREYARAKRERERLARQEAECVGHPGEHCESLRCPECGWFSRDSWDTSTFHTENGFQQRWGGICVVHGEWSDSA